MTEEAKAAAAAYMREWRAKNKDKVKDYNRKHWEKIAEERKKRQETGKAVEI